jgi:hypothetical protein
MADVKISGLPASTVPLAGTEVLPIVQGGTTKQVSIANVTAGRAIAATSITTDTYKAASSSGGALQNSGGTPQLQWGAGGGNNLSVDVAININPANAAVAISPTGTGTLTINPATASTMNNVAIGGTTALAGRFTGVTSTDLTASTAVVADANKKLVSLVQPAVSAYKSTNQSITTTTATKITFDTENFDTNNNFASSTFTPTVAGYYQISSGFFPSADSTTFSRAFISIYKNGAEWQRLQDVTTIGQFITFLGASGSCLVYCNGTTDYIEAYGFIIGTNPVIGSGSTITYFDAVLVRGA